MIKNKKAQITIFVIIAIIIVAGIAGFFVVRSIYFPSVPASIAPVYDYYISCIESAVKDGASIMGSQAGYIELPEFSAGSTYAPFSNQLDFMGLGVPYWYYISGNGIAKEQIPSKAEMEKQLENYLVEELDCDFGNYINQGFNITLEKPSKADVEINDESISASVNQKMIISKGEDTYSLSSYSSEAQSNLGRFYNLARDIYDYEKSSMFLENYSIDVLYTYAPVSGAEFNCSPLIWSPYEVADRLKKALEANIGMIKINGDYYTSKNPHTNYFIAGKGSDLNVKNSQVSFLYSSAWPSRIEIWPTKNNLMTADPVGTQAGLGALGFCYVPYKFVYDVYFPVLIQIYDSTAEETFEFPVAIVIDKNVPREAISGELIEQPASICDNANTNISVYTYNVNSDPVEASIKYKCINDVCSLGKTKIDNESGYAYLEAAVPQCTNALITATSEGYKDEKYFISTNEETTAYIALDRQYKMQLEVYVDGSPVSQADMAVLIVNENIDNATEFVSSAAYPLQKEITLAEGDYNFDLKVYRSSSFTIPPLTKNYCAKAPKEGLLGIFGLEEEKCTEITIPSQTIQNVIGAGGAANYYTSQSELDNARVMRVYASSITPPTSIENLGAVYDLAGKKSIDIKFA